MLASYTRRYGCDHVTGTCQEALQAYVRFHEKFPETAKEAVVVAVRGALCEIQKVASRNGGGTIDVEAETLRKLWSIDFEQFAGARHSVRNFSPEPIDKTLIERAVSIAQKAPSVCNRQGWHVYALTDRDAIRRALVFQNGNAGFRECIPCLLLITGDNSTMLFTHERNQIWVDAGLFSMALVYALQSLGLASCCLNLSVPFNVEKKLGELYRVPRNERVVMMIAVGHIPDRLLVAYSERNPVSSVLTWADKNICDKS